LESKAQELAMLELFVYQLQSYESDPGVLSFPRDYDPGLHAGSGVYPGLRQSMC